MNLELLDKQIGAIIRERDDARANLKVAVEALNYYALIHPSAYDIVSGEPAIEALSKIQLKELDRVWPEG